MQGGIIVRHHYNAEWEIPYRMELIGVDMIDTSKNNREENVKNGLKKDSYQRVIGIYLHDDEDKRSSSLHTMEDMDYVIFGWMSLSQYTAVSRLVSILKTLDSTSQYTESEVRAAMERAKSGVYWHTELYDVIMETLNEEFKEEGLSKSEIAHEAKELLERLAQRGVGKSGATPTPKEDSITKVDSKTDSVFDTISNQSQKKISSAMGGSQVSVYRDIDKGNYASIKAAISFDEEDCKIIFNNIEEYIISEYLERLFTIGVQMGFIRLSRNKFFKDKEKYFEWDVLRTSRRVINEKDDAIATAKNLETNVTTISAEYGRRGLDYIEEQEKQIDLDIKVELMRKEKYKNAGLALPIVEENKNNEEILEEEEKENE